MLRSSSIRRVTALMATVAATGAMLAVPIAANAQAQEFDSGLNVASPIPVPDLGPGASNRKTLVIGIDGIRWDQMRLADTPNIQRILDGGETAVSYTFAPAGGSGSFALADTVSGPSWSSILTGVWPDKHGVTDNSFTGKDYAAYPDFLTRAERARPELTTLAAADWQPIAMDAGGGAVITDEIDYRYGSGVGGADYLTEDAREADLVARTIYQQRTDISFVYLGAADENTGGDVTGATYRSALESLDRNVGAMLRGIEEFPSFAGEDWRVVLVNDHGLTDDGGHGNGTTLGERMVYTSFFDPKAGSGTVRNDLKPVDIAPTVLDRAGVSVDPTWGLDGAPYQDVAADDFDGMRDALRPKVDEPDISSTTLGWTDRMPQGWRVDNSSMPTGGVSEWRGWVLTTNEFWSSPGDDRNQGRENFVRGRDVIAVADSDAWDDLGLPKSDRRMSSTLITPAYDVQPGATVDLSYVTQYQQEAGQTSEVSVAWNTGESVMLKRYEQTISGPESFEVVAPERATSFEVRFAYAGSNNWFWALDQVRVDVTQPPTTEPTPDPEPTRSPEPTPSPEPLPTGSAGAGTGSGSGSSSSGSRDLAGTGGGLPAAPFGIALGMLALGVVLLSAKTIRARRSHG